jgi:ELWxxDGT repeat protein
MLFFTISNELWKSDGTIAGTQAVKDFSAIQNMVAVGDI